MPILITKHGAGTYVAEVSPPHGKSWRSDSPMRGLQIMLQLSRLGCHSTDIADALEEADPDWAFEYDKDARQAQRD